MTKASFQPGITTLLEKHPRWLAGRRVGLLSHPAAVNRDGASSAELLIHACGGRLVSLFGPEHGFLGVATAGEVYWASARWKARRARSSVAWR